MKEQWRAVPNWPSYEVSSLGRVRRGDRIKSPFSDRKGYLRVKLWDKSRARNFMIHRLVALAFIGELPAGHVCRHLNGDNADNRLANIAYGTPKENEADKHAHGTAGSGEKHPAAKLIESQVVEIRKAFVPYCKKRGTRALAAQYGMSQSQVSAIVCRRVWKHL